MMSTDPSVRTKSSMAVSMLAAGVFTLFGLGCGEGGEPAASTTTETTAAAPAPAESAPASPQLATSNGTTAAPAVAPAKTITPDLRTDSSQPAPEKSIGPASGELAASRPTDRAAATTPTSQAADARKPGPAFRFEPAVLDMGEMMPDVSKTMAVRLVNVTGEPVKVNRAVPSCGCTTLGAPKDPIAPGEFADIEITLKPGVATGVKLSKKVTFDIDGYAPQVLTVEGNVAEYVAATPKILSAPPSPDDASASESGRVSLASTDGVAFIVTGVNPTVVDGLPTPSATEHELVIDWAKWEEAKRPVRVTFTTDHPNAPTVAVTIRRPVRAPGDPAAPAAPGADRPAATPTGSAALVAAARSGDVARIAMEIANGTDVNRVDPATSRTALHWASQEGQVAAIKALLEADADLAAIDRVGMSPLAIAAKGGHVDAVTVLLDAGGSVNMRDAAGGSPLLWAAGLGNSQTVELLVGRGAEVNIADVNGLTPLLWATSIGRDPRTVEILLAANANAEQADRLSGDTPAIRAAKNTNPQVLEFLIAKGVDLSKANLKGVTPLMTAAGSGGVEQVRMLLAAKPDLSLKDSRGWTALDYALNRSDASREAVVAMVQEASGN